MTIDLLKDDHFSVWVPGVVEFDFAKSELAQEEDSDNPVTNGYRLAGYCSTGNRDRQEEIVVQKGLDFSEFVAHGWFNDNHKQGTTDAIGYPINAELHEDRGWHTNGFLLKGYPPAEKIVMLAKALADTPRRLGFSIEGKVMERGHDNRIVRAKVRNVAVTNCPVNTDCTWDLVSKSFASATEIEDSFGKALSAGYQSPGGTGGAALRLESLEGGKRKKKSLLTHTRTKVTGKSMTLGEAVVFLQRVRPDYQKSTCERIARALGYSKE